MMTEVAGEVADGLIVHPFNSMPFLTDHALPAVHKGLAKSGRERSDFILQINAIVITGETEEARAIATESVKGLTRILCIHTCLQATYGGGWVMAICSRN